MNRKIIIFTLLFLLLAVGLFLVYSGKNLELFSKKGGSAYLKVKPERLEVEVEEGEKTKAKLELVNNSDKRSFLNLYKTEETKEDFKLGEGAVDKWLAPKKIGESIQEENLKQFADFSGAPWLVYFPYYAIIEPNESLEIKLTIDAKDLAVGNHFSNLIALGTKKEELSVIPVEVTVTSAPKVRVSKVEIDDGISENTSGNQNKVANSGEKVILSAYLVNEGGSPANNIEAELIISDSAVKVLDNTNSRIASLKNGEAQTISFLLEIGEIAFPDFPPSAILNIKAKNGKEWSESFYLGEEGSFEYPTGLTEPEE